MYFYDSSKKQHLNFAEDFVSFYLCGPTVYDHAHLGHARSNLAFDLMRRYFIYIGKKVFFVRNITDIDDKIIKKAKEKNVPISFISEEYTKSFQENMQVLGILNPDEEPKATENIDKMIEMIAILLNKNIAYQISNGDIYFDISKDTSLLSISNNNSIEHVSRLEKNIEKRNEGDFVLWKADKDYYISSFGTGRPGWHIECSAMIERFFYEAGKELIFHVGGKDLLFPHHENEASQTRMTYNHEISKYWMHNGFVKINGEKMAKSLGNSFLLKDFLKEYHPELIRYYLLSVHYRSDFNFSEEDVILIKSRLDKLFRLKQRIGKGKISSHLLKNSLLEALSEDFNVSKAYALIDRFINESNFDLDTEDTELNKERIRAAFFDIQELFGFGIDDNYFLYNVLNIEEIESLIEERNNLRILKKFSEADDIRNKLLEKNIILNDSKNETTWEINLF